MGSDERDLYDIAFGEDCSSNESTSKSNNILETETQATNIAPDDVSIPVALLRNLLTGSRSQIEKLKHQNEVLATNLKNAIASGSVVICPHCTNCFRDRVCSMKPRSMRKMRARNCVEIEFETLEDLEAWLYLNQLETNKDGMPTVMEVKKPSNQERSLESVGSLLPALIENEKERHEKRHETTSLNKTGKAEDKIRKDEHSSKTGVKIDCKFKKSSGSNKKEKRDDYGKENNKSVNISNRLVHKSDSPEETRPLREKVEERQRRKDADKEKSSKKKVETSKRSPVNKRKLSPDKEDVPEAKVSKKSISERIRFPQSINEATDAKTAVFGRTNQGKELERSSRNDNIDNISSPSMKITSSQTERTTKRAPIVWGDDHESSSKKQDSLLKIPEQSTRNAFELKIKAVEKKNDAQKPDTVSKFVTTAPAEERKSKYKFVPTAKKNLIVNSESKCINTPTTSEPDARKHEYTISLDVNTTIQNSISREAGVRWTLFNVKKSAVVQDHVSTRALERQAFNRKWLQKTVIIDDFDQADASSELLKDKGKNAQFSSGEIIKINEVPEKKAVDMKRIAELLKLSGVSDEGISILKKQSESIGMTAINTLVSDKTISAPQGSTLTEIDAENSKELSAHSVQRTAFSIASHESEQVPICNMPTQNSTYGSSNPKCENPMLDDRNDTLNEFFPDLAYRKNQQDNVGTPTNTDSSYRPFSTESFGSMVDREEEELAHLIREDSAVPPSNDCLLNMNPDDSERTFILQGTSNRSNRSPKESTDANEDWSEFCLEDVEDDVDETTRDRKLSEMSTIGDVEKNMEWTVNDEMLDENIDGPDSQTQTILESEINEEEKEVEEKEVVTVDKNGEPSRTESVPLEMNSDFRLSDDEDLVSPMTSTPRPEYVDDGMEEPAKNVEEDAPFINSKDDSFVDELDWNYGTDVDEEDGQDDQHEGNNTVIERIGVGGTCDTCGVAQNDLLEDGEISDEEVNEEKKEEKKIERKPIRERIQFFSNEKKGEIDDDARRRRRERSPRRSDDRRRHHSPRRRSKENRDRSYKRDHRSPSHKTFLKRRN